MTNIFEAQAEATKPNSTATIKSLFSELVIWNQAWVEVQRLRRMEASALADVGIPQTAINEISVSQVAARIRIRA